MADRTDNNRVFDDFKILTVAALFLILNYAFAIGNLFMVVFKELWDLGHDKSLCVDTNDIVWTWSVIFNSIHYLAVTIYGICADLALNRYICCMNMELGKILEILFIAISTAILKQIMNRKKDTVFP